MSLHAFSGLPLFWDDAKKELLFAGSVISPDIRTLGQMREVIYDKNWLASANPKMPLYYMYRDVCMSEDKKSLSFSGLRYDITVFPEQMLGIEYLKTAGHNHPLAPDQKVSYPELYEVVAGEAIFLIQKVDGKKIISVRVVHAKEGDKLVIPPDFGHITINPGRATLITANWIADGFKSDYEPMKKLGGGAFFFTTSGIIKNPNYESASENKKEKELLEPKKLKPTPAKFLGLKDKEPMYSLVKNKERLEFLKSPEKFEMLFRECL